MPAKTENRLIVVTGASRGLGRAMAQGFAARGHRVIGCGRAAMGETTSYEYQSLDVADDGQVARWAGPILKQHGPPDLLVNNAAVINQNAPLWEVSADEFNRVLAVNVAGVVNLIRHFVPAMIARGSGVIVNFSSYWGRAVAAEVAPYCASKWAIEGLTRALAQDLPSGLAAVPFNPGIIDTDMLRSTFGDGAGHYVGPRQWAEATVPFLLLLGPEHNGKPLTAPGQ